MPETGQIFYEAGFANFHLHPPTEVHFKNDDRAPLLIVGATKDDTVPASVARKQYEKYEQVGRPDGLHRVRAPAPVMAADGWEEVATAIETWIERVLASAPAATQELTT